MGKACWACKKKKVRCDLKSPTCSKCIRNGTNCEYGIQLSWPQNGDSRRSVVLHQAQRQRYMRSREDSNLHFLGVECSDVILHRALTLNKPYANGSAVPSRRFHRSESIPRMLAWIPLESDTFDEALISHYENVVAAMLTYAKDAQFQRLLLSMSFTDTSSSSVAVRQALYALTALHLGRLDVAMSYKQKALQAFFHSYSLQHVCSTGDRLQQLAAGLLLTLFEMYDSSKTVQGWALHACNAKKAANYVYFLDRTYEGDTRILLEWMFYHDALSRFSASHWEKITPGMQDCMKDHQIRRAVQLSGDSSKIINTIGCSAEVLEVIASVCDYTHLAEHYPMQKSSDEIEALDRLERRLKYAKQDVSDPDLLNKRVYKDDPVTKVAELFRLAGLIYLYRAGQGLPSKAPKVQTAVESGYRILKSLSVCDRSFPLTILGCEAQSDEERLVILDLISRTQACIKFGNIGVAHRFIKASWAQDDLDPDKEVNYVQKFDAIMSRNKSLPSFT